MKKVDNRVWSNVVTKCSNSICIGVYNDIIGRTNSIAYIKIDNTIEGSLYNKVSALIWSGL